MIDNKSAIGDEDFAEFAKALSEGLVARGLDPKDKKVQDTVAVCAQIFGETITDMGKTMADFNERLKRLVAAKAP